MKIIHFDEACTTQKSNNDMKVLHDGRWKAQKTLASPAPHVSQLSFLWSRVFTVSNTI